MNKRMLGIAILLILAGVSLFFFSSQNKNKSSSPSPTSQDGAPTTSISQVDLGSGGSSYLDENGAYSILYPSDYTLDTQDAVHIRIYKRGEEERPQSEMSDGVLMVFESVNLSGKSLESLVDTRIKESTADGVTKVAGSKKAVTQNSYSGFYYTLTGPGSSQNLILQKDTSSTNAVVVTYSISDPEQKGYQAEVDAVLSSITLLK